MRELDLGKLYALTDQPEQAVAEWETRIELSPTHPWSYQFMGSFECARGRSDRGISLLQHAAELSPDDSLIISDLGYCYAISDRRSQARKLVHDLEAEFGRRYVDPTVIALVHVGLDEHELALDWLERAVQLRALHTPMMSLDPRYAPLRDDPRFQRLLERIGLPRGPQTAHDRMGPPG